MRRTASSALVALALSTEVERARAEIACIQLAGSEDVERACRRLQALAVEDAPFAVAFVVRDPRCLDDGARRFTAAVRAIPGRRARFGAWCRAVGYVFESDVDRAAAHRHLRAARFA